MKQDKDLIFLASCQNDDLQALCDILTCKSNGDLRETEQLVGTDAYISYYPDNMQMMAKELGEELRKFGSNTIKTFIRRGEADSYETIVRRVCKRMNVNVDSADDTQTMERELLMSVCKEVTGKLSYEELSSLADEIGIPRKNINRQMLASAIMIALRSSTRYFSRAVYYISSRMANILLGRWIGMMGLSTVGRYLGMAAGPIGWAALAGWTISDIASPAYRVMIPAVIMVASMRFRQNALLTQEI